MFIKSVIFKVWLDGVGMVFVVLVKLDESISDGLDLVVYFFEFWMGIYVFVFS